uniref:Uncharacterized protein n=1 Tax=Oryza brachyantha TaxID=4533 RepID=J3LNK1_ORYBR
MELTMEVAMKIDRSMHDACIALRAMDFGSLAGQKPLAAEVDPDEDHAAEQRDDGAVVLGGVERQVAGEEVLKVLQPPDAVGAQHLDHAVDQLPLRLQRLHHQHLALAQPHP